MNKMTCKEADEVMWWTSPRVRLQPQIAGSDVGCDPGLRRSQHKEGRVLEEGSGRSWTGGQQPVCTRQVV